MGLGVERTLQIKFCPARACLDVKLSHQHFCSTLTLSPTAAERRGRKRWVPLPLDDCVSELPLVDLLVKVASMPFESADGKDTFFYIYVFSWPRETWLGVLTSKSDEFHRETS